MSNSTTPLTTPSTSSSTSITSTPSTSISSTISSTSSSSSTSTTSSSTTTPTTPTTTQPPPTSVVVTTPSDATSTLPPTTVTLTSTSATPAPTPKTSTKTTSQSSSSTSSDAATLATQPASSSSGGLSSGGKIAVAVVVPVVAVAILVFALLFLWRRRKQKKDAEELRRKEVEEYGYNPNTDPTVPTIGSVSAAGAGDQQMAEDGNGGYRGWGTTSMGRKPSTNLSSGNAPIGMAVSDNGTTSGVSPTHGPGSEAHSGDPLLNSPNRPPTAESERIGALGAAPVAGANRQDIHRGPSNASSSYSAGNRSENSAEAPIPGAPHPSNYYNTDAAYNFDDQGPYAEGSGQPVIRNVQARRNTQIENPTIVPQQGNSGIAQNF